MKVRLSRDRGRAGVIWGAVLLAFAFAGSSEAQQASDVQGLIRAGSLDEMRWPNFSDLRTSLQKFYEPAGFSPAWIEGSNLRPQALALIELFKGAEKKGLDPEDFDASRWDERIRVLKESSVGSAAARVDVALTVCAMRYVSDLRIGRINPRHFQFGLSVENKKYDLADFLRDRILGASNVSAALDEVEPPFPGYRRTEEALTRYIELARTDDGAKLPDVAKPVNPGKSYAGVPRLAEILRRLGDLPSETSVPEGSQVYGEPLGAAVKRFQRRHGLDDDGRLGPGTIRQLNVLLTERVRQLQLTLERWRWLPAEFSSPPVVVNIPEFQLRALDERNNAALSMRVVVGKAMKTQTPVFSDEITHVVLRPYWNVPRSILRDEILPRLRRDRGYLARKNYEVATFQGAVVASAEISDDVLAQLQAGKLMVRQKPGPDNSLGLVKLMFPNEYSVYLHSTPAPELFSRSRRDFSHGCIRVEKPAELTAWALRNNPGWTLERVRQQMQEGKDNVSVSLVKPIPVFIVYGTALAIENGDVLFRDDIYGHDAELATALAKGYPYP